MNKDNKKTNIPTLNDSVRELPELIKNTKYYQLLISNRGTSFRMSMIEKIEKVFTPTLGFKTWKNRFLYPEKNIPIKKTKEIAAIMEEALIFELNEQQNFILDEIAIIEKEILELKTKNQTYCNILTETKAAIKIYKNGEK